MIISHAKSSRYTVLRSDMPILNKGEILKMRALPNNFVSSRIQKLLHLPKITTQYEILRWAGQLVPETTKTLKNTVLTHIQSPKHTYMQTY